MIRNALEISNRGGKLPHPVNSLRLLIMLALLVMGALAAHAQSTQRQVFIVITDGTLQDQSFGPSVSGSSQTLLAPATAYSYSIVGTCVAEGTYIPIILGGSPQSIASALDTLDPNYSQYLQGSIANPNAGGTLPCTLLDKVAAGGTNINLGFVDVSATAADENIVNVDATGRCFYTATNVIFEVPTGTPVSDKIIITSATITATSVLDPTFTTGSATVTGSTSATLAGTVNPNGAYTSVWFTYGTTGTYGMTTGMTSLPVLLSGTGVSQAITGLSPGTTYHFTVTGSNVLGTFSGSDMTFQTTGGVSGTAPTVVTGSASGVGTSGAVLNGTVNANGLSTAVTFNYGLTSTYGSVITASQSPVSGNSATAVSGSVSGLLAGTQYHFQVSGSNSSGMTTGSDMVFTTASSGSAPTVTTGSATGVTTTGATLNGSVNPNGLSTTVTFNYGLTGTFGSTVTATQSPVSGNASTPVSAPLTGLTPGQTYFYQVTGSNSAGGNAGSTLSFTTPASASQPTVVTGSASAVGTTTATLNGTVNPNGAMTAVTFSYGLTGTYGNTVAASTPNIGGTTTAAVDAPITGLMPGTTYHFAVSGSNSQGMVTGSDAVFTTGSAVPPAVVTGSASGITTALATLNGTVNPNGVATTAWFQYGPTNGYGLVTPTASAGSGTSAVPVAIQTFDVPEGTTIHYRIVAASTSGTSYGDDATFTTQFVLTAVAGSYQAAITGSSNATSGLATISITKTGGFTTSLDLGGKTTKLMGKISAVSGTGSATKSGLTVQLQAANTASGLSVTGSVSGTENLSFVAAQEMTSNAALRYTVRIPPPADASLPQGNGYGAMTVSKTGKITVSGMLGDGTSYTAGAALLDNNTWAFYAPLYGKQGCVVGTITIESSTNGDMDGAVTWIKPMTSGSYTPGAFNTQVELYGSAYAKPKNAPVISSTSGDVVIAGGGLPVMIPGIPAELTAANKFIFPSPPAGLSIKISVVTASGLFSGSVSAVDPLTSKKITEKFNGAVYQGNLQFGAGVFKGPTEAGSVDFFEP